MANPLLAGREFNEHDTGQSQNVVLISQTGAKKVFPGENPIGKTLLVTSGGTPCEIVGIVGDIRSQRIKEEPAWSFIDLGPRKIFRSLVSRCLSTLNTEAVTKLAQSALSKVNSGLAIAVPQSMDAIVAQALGQARLMMWLLGIFAGVALLLASIGFTEQSRTASNSALARSACGWHWVRKRERSALDRKSGNENLSSLAWRSESWRHLRSAA